MFNLDQAMTEWRRQMSAGGIKAPSVLDELESHVREDVERQMRSGTNVENAFEAAVRKIGPASALKNEFKKSTAAAVAEKLMIAVAVLFVAFGIFLSSVTVVFCYLTPGERFVGLTAMSLTIVTACGWPKLVPLLPLIRNQRKRQAIEVACLAAGFGICTLFIQLLVHRFENPTAGIVPAIGFFGLFPIAVGFGIAAGLERAHLRRQRNCCVSN
jgi:hypothetical protein